MLVRELTADAQLAYDRREEQLGQELTRELERRVVLSVVDRKWREHLYEMDYLQEGIGLRAMAQRDPLVEYQREGAALFQTMNDAVKEESVAYLFNLEVQLTPPEAVEAEEVGVAVPVPMLSAKGLDHPQRPAHLTYSAPTVDGEGGVEVHDEGDGSRSAPRAPVAAAGGNRAERRAQRKKRRN
jgi:preprotein translocase subunit SecA